MFVYPDFDVAGQFEVTVPLRRKSGFVSSNRKYASGATVRAEALTYDPRVHLWSAIAGDESPAYLFEVLRSRFPAEWQTSEAKMAADPFLLQPADEEMSAGASTFRMTFRCGIAVLVECRCGVAVWMAMQRRDSLGLKPDLGWLISVA